MPLISAYFGVSEVSILLENKDGSFDSINFPFAYTDSAFSNQISQNDFYKFLLELYLKNKKLSLTDYDILTTGFLTPPDFNFEIKYSLPLFELLKSIEDYYPMHVNDFTVLTKNAVLSYENLEKNPGDMDKVEEDYFANLALYPQLIPTDLTKQSILDTSLVRMLYNSTGYMGATENRIIFTGSRFSGFSRFPELSYVFMMDLINKPGIYEIYLDKNNNILLQQLIKNYRPASFPPIIDFIEKVGFVINTGGDTECLVTTDLDTKQFFEVKKGNIFVLPLSQEVEQRINIKSSILGNIEKSVKGGKLGLIIDARENKYPMSDNIRVFNDCVRQLDLCLRRL